MSSRFSEHALRCLKSAGWTPGRTIDTESYVTALRRDAYDVPGTVVEFLAEFGGLEIHYPHYRAPSEDDWCHFNAKVAADNVFPEIVQEWNEVVKSRLIPVGEAFHNHMTLLMTSGGAIYAGYEDIFHLVGETPEQAIEVLCGGRDISQISL